MIPWFVRNRVAANLLLFGISLGGFLTLGGIPQELLPEAGPAALTIRTVFPGAGAAVVEEGVLIGLEDALREVEGVSEMAATAADGLGVLTLEVEAWADFRTVSEEVRELVEAFASLPEGAEDPVISEVAVDRELLRIAVHGAADERSLREAALFVRDAVGEVPGVSRVALASGREYEIAIEVREEALTRFGQTFDRLAAAIRRGSADIPGGSLRTGEREVRLRAEAEAATAADFARIPVIATPGGGLVTVGDLAAVTDGFADSEREARMNGEPAVFLTVSLAPKARLLDTTDAVLARIESIRLPEGIGVTPWYQTWRLFESRMEVLVRNGLSGLALIFLVLFFTLSSRLAVWTAAGLPVAFFGAFLLMPGLSMTVNMISLFGFILTLGIVVDDAIVVGENIQRQLEADGPSDGRTDQQAAETAAVRGTQQVLVPAAFGVLTTMAAFLPLLGLPGALGELMGTLPRIVIPVLAFSLLEAAWILPHHLAHGGVAGFRRSRRLARLRAGAAAVLDGTVRVLYRPALRFALGNPLVILACGVFWLALAVGLVRGGFVPVDTVPPFEADTVVVQLRLPPGSGADATRRAAARIEGVIGRIREEIRAAKGIEVQQHLAVSIGERLATGRGGAIGGESARAGGALGQLVWELRPADERPEASTRQLADRLRELARPLPEGAEMTLGTSILGGAADISLQISGDSMEELRQASVLLQSRLAAYQGVVLVRDDFEAGAAEVVARARPAGAGLGIGAADFGRQLRQAFHGEEVQRIQRGGDEIKVLLRYPDSARRNLESAARMLVRRPEGGTAPLGAVASLSRETGLSVIRRVDGRRAVTVHADVDPSLASSGAVLGEVRSRTLPELRERFPEVRFAVVGLAGEQAETLGALGGHVLLALLVVYVLLAVPLASWSQPFVILAAVPFGLAGAVFGHQILGVNLGMTSFFGMAPLVGIVVNDALVLLHFMNQKRREGMSVREAAFAAGLRRFRAVVLTSVTTCAGLAPLLGERSVQAQFLVPMAASLAFGVAFATLITLLLVPALYVLLADLVPAASRPR